MLLLSRRKLKILKVCLVSPTLELILLLSYLILFTIVIIMGVTKSGTNVATYHVRQNLREYFGEDKATQVARLEDVYAYLEWMLYDRLYLLNRSSPYFPLGPVRLVQYRVTPPPQCTSVQCSSLSCLLPLYSPECNPLFLANVTEATQYPMLYSNSTTCALPPDCSEYNYTATDISGYHGRFGKYSTQGYVVDFWAEEGDNRHKLESLRGEQWLD